MSERTQRALWATFAIVALALAAATAQVYRESRRVAAVRRGASYRIVYTAFRESTGQLYHFDLRGRDTKQLTDVPGLNGFAAAQPSTVGDHEQLVAYLRLDFDMRPRRQDDDPNAGTRGELYTISAEGGEPTLVSAGLQYMWPIAPSWSADGQEIVFAAVEDLNNDGQAAIDELGLYTRDLPTSMTSRVADVQAQLLGLQRSPSEPLVIVTLALDDNVLSRLIDLRSGEVLLDGPSPAACWSPDGSHLAAYLPEERRIHVLYPDGSESFSVSGPPAGVVELLWVPAWPATGESHAGTLVAVAAPFGQESMDAGQLYMRLVTDDDASWELVSGPEDYVIHTAASPDGHYLAYTLYRGSANRAIPRTDLMLLDLSTRQITQLSEDPDFEGLATWILSKAG